MSKELIITQAAALSFALNTQALKLAQEKGDLFSGTIEPDPPNTVHAVHDLDGKLIFAADGNGETLFEPINQKQAESYRELFSTTK